MPYACTQKEFYSRSCLILGTEISRDLRIFAPTRDADPGGDLKFPPGEGKMLFDRKETLFYWSDV